MCQPEGAPMVIEPSLAMARLSGKLDELKEVMKFTCNAWIQGRHA